MNNWRARQAQLVWFTRTSVSATASGLFIAASDGQQPVSTSSNQITQVDPESRQMRPMQVHTCQGMYRTSNLVVNVQPERVDIFLQPIKQDFAGNSPPLFEDKASVMEMLKSILIRVSGMLDNVIRVGIVSNYVIPSQNLEEANDHVLKAIGIDLEYLRQGSDISFGVNKRKNINGVDVNRILRWQVDAFANLSFSINAFGVLAQQQTQPIYAASMALDINSVLDLSSLANLTVQDIFLELLHEEDRLWFSASPKALES